MKRVGSTFGIPTILGAATLVALIAGLLGDGAVDVVAWVGLSVPLVAVGRALQAFRFVRSVLTPRATLIDGQEAPS